MVRCIMPPYSYRTPLALVYLRLYKALMLPRAAMLMISFIISIMRRCHHG